MRTGRPLPDLAAEIQRQAAAKKDYIAPARRVRVETQEREERRFPALRLEGVEGWLGMTDVFHEQLGTKLGIPAKYYDRMRTEAPELLATNANHWLLTRGDERHLVRTLDGSARAFLSDRYRPLDNVDMAEAVLPAIAAAGCQVISAELTERRLYLKATTPRVQAEIKKGDVVEAGVVVSNSEVGMGAVKVEPMIYRLVCLNGAIASDFRVRKFHVGRGGNGEGEDLAAEFFRDETRQADDRAFWLKVQDTVRGALTEAGFLKIVDRMREAADRRIEADPVAVVERVQKRFALTDGERGSVLNHLVTGGDLSAYGLMNAITRASQDVENYDRTTELERLGYDVVELQASEWRVLTAKN